MDAPVCFMEPQVGFIEAQTSDKEALADLMEPQVGFIEPRGSFMEQQICFIERKSNLWTDCLALCGPASLRVLNRELTLWSHTHLRYGTTNWRYGITGSPYGTTN